MADPPAFRVGSWARTTRICLWTDDRLVRMHRLACGVLLRVVGHTTPDRDWTTLTVEMVDDTGRYRFHYVSPTALAPAEPSEEELAQWTIAALSQ